MGNKAGKICVDGNTYSYEDVDEFLVITVEAAESSAECCTEERERRLEDRIDSGYVDVSARQSRESNPQPDSTEKEVLITYI